MLPRGFLSVLLLCLHACGSGSSASGDPNGSSDAGPGAGGAASGAGGAASGGARTGSGGEAGGASGDGGAPEIPDAAAPADAGLDWLTRTELGRGQGVIVEQVTYLSGALRIFGQVCRPDDSLPHPLILVNHGGFEGNVDEAFQGDLAAESFCLSGARLGYVIGESSYRGEDGSDGEIEVCLGEVDDVAAMLAVLRAQAYVDPSRVGAFGGSHGGCITTSLALRDPSLRAAVDFFGPSDLAQLTTWWQDQLDQGEPAPYCAPQSGTSWCTQIHELLLGVVETAIGGPPSPATAAAYRARSPAFDLDRLTVPMLFFQGTDDAFVNLDQACNKRAALIRGGRAPEAWYLDGALSPRSPADVCGGAYRADPLPSTESPAAWAGDGPYFIVYEGQGHGMTGAANAHSATIALLFLIAHL